MNDDETRKQVEEDASEDLDLDDEDADKVGGGFLKIKLDESTSPGQKIQLDGALSGIP